MDTIRVSDQERFQLELEFVQCLSNPLYLNWLATKKYFEQPAFISYLSYLEYWRQPAYAKYLSYPQSLQFLTLLQDPAFRTAIGDASYAEHVQTQQGNFFRNYLGNRVADGQPS